MGSRVGGPTPLDETGKGEQKPVVQQPERLGRLEKVKEVEEVENEGTRKRFRQYMEPEEEDLSPRAPTPFEPEFYSLDGVNDSSVADPSYSPPPDVSEGSGQAFAPQGESPSPLPRSREFWKKIDEPPGKPSKGSQLKEAKAKKGTEKGAETKKGTKGKEELAVSAKEKVRIAKSTEGKKPAGTSQKAEKTPSPWQLESPPEKKKQAEKGGPLALPQEPRAPEKAGPPPSRPAEKRAGSGPSIATGPMKEEEPTSPLQPKEGRGKKRDEERGEREKSEVEITAPSDHALPPAVAATAQTATAQAMPYLNAQISPLFFQMVGTMYVMSAPPGIARTEILLNAPSFAGSRFFGSKIILERYSTAPNSFNIRLTGNDEAVKAFNQNLSNLYAAFQNGKLPFEIGRIEAEYSTERPVFHRKEPGAGKGGTGGEGSRERG